MTGPTPTSPAQAGKGLHTTFIKRRVPDWTHQVTADDLKTLRKGVLAGLDPNDLNASWVTQASEAQRRALLDCVAASVASSHVLAQSLKGFKGITEFAEPLLKRALREQLGSQLDATRHVLYHMRAPNLCTRQPLLQAALLNFESGTAFDQVSLKATSAIAPDGALLYEKDGPEIIGLAANRVSQPFRYRYTEKTAIEPVDFARVCRQIDLGKQYQDHLDAIFEGRHSALIRQQMIQAGKDLMAVHLHRARMNGHIGEAASAAVLALLRGESPTYNGHAIKCTRIELFGSAISEVLVIGCSVRVNRLPSDSWPLQVTNVFLPVIGTHLLARNLRADEQKVIVYMPGAGRHEWAEYASIQTFEHELAVALRKTSMQTLFAQWVKHDQLQRFQSRLKAQRYDKKWNAKGYYDQVDNPTPDLFLKEKPLLGNPFDALHDEHQARMRENAKLWAVPTAVVDNDALWERLKRYAELGLDVLNIAAFFVPVLGQVMLAVTAVQLSLEVYHGIEAWNVGDRDAAWSHFESVALNVGFAAVLVGAGAAARIAPKLQTSAWVDRLVPVDLPNGQTRLWKPDIAPYRSDVELAPTLRPNAMGQYEVEGKTYIRLGEGVYEKTFDHRLNAWRIKHPSDPDAYQPELQHNRFGAWRHRYERPLEWDRLALLRRMSHETEQFSDAVLEQIGDASGVDDDALRRMYMDRAPLPAQLEDTLEYFKTDREVDALIEHLRDGTCVRGSCEYALPMVVEMPNWPQERVLEVFQGPELRGASQRYGAAAAQVNLRPTIKITRGELANGGLPARVLSALDEPQIIQLLGREAATNVGRREQVFRDRLANFAGGRKKALFDSLTRSRETPDPDVMRLQRHFPSLSGPAARSVLTRASTTEMAQLRATGRIPLRLASEIRVQIQQGTLNRALAGMSLENMASTASDRLALHGMQQLPDWPSDLRVEMREGSIHGALLDSIGSEQASRCNVLVKKGDSFQAFERARALNPLPRQGRNLYESLAAVLPEPSANAREGSLRQALARYAAAHRDEMSRLLKLRPINTGRGPSMRLPSGRLGYMASGRGAGFGGDALVSRIRAVYPNLSDEQASHFIEYHRRSGKTDQQIMHVLNNRLRESDSLVTALIGWTDADQSPLEYGLPSRRFIAENIMAAWREGSISDGGSATELNLRGAVDLPVWEADFGHVQALALNSAQLLGEEASGLLGRFANVKRLNIVVESEHLADFGQQLAQLPACTELALVVTDVPDTTSLSRALQAMPQLLELELKDWDQALDVSALHRLRRLKVEGALSAWPTGVLDLPQLETLNLQGTSIATLPDQLLTGHQPLWRGLTLDWARLEPQTFARVHEYLGSHLPHQIGEERMLERYCEMRLRKLIPDDSGFAGSVLRQFKSQGLAGRPLLDKVGGLHREYDQFNQQLDSWQDRIVRVDRRQVSVYTRSHAAAKIRNCWLEVLKARYVPAEPVAGPSWRTHLADEVLDLSGGPIGDLPALPDVSFAHVRQLNLTGARLLTADLDTFLAKFPNLRELHLNGNRMTELPKALDSLGQLEELNLARNELSITPSLQQRLNRLTSLRTLNLRYNRVETLNVRAMVALEILDLSHTATRTWPEGALALTKLRRLDLSHSAVTQVPDVVFSAHPQLLNGLKLQGCRLTPQTMSNLQRLAASSALETPGGISRERLLEGRTGGDPEFFPIEVTENPNLLLPLPLSPRGSELRLTPAGRLQRLDPNLSLVEAIRRVEALEAQGLSALQIEERLQTWQQHQQALIGRLNAWIDVRAYREGEDWVSALHRRQAADRLLRCWQETLRAAPRAGVEAFDLSELSLGDLPELPVTFEHITALNVSNVRMTAEGSSAFFRAFPRLEHVTLNHNALSVLPESLSLCERLTRLDANYNDLRNSAQLNQQLRGLTRLESLDLGDNTLDVFDVRGLERLQSLDLRGNILGEWPEGVLEAPQLRSLNLSNNQIETLPADALLPAHHRLMAGTDLSDNLLLEEDLLRLQDYAEATGQGLGFTLAEIDQGLQGYELSDNGSFDGSDGEAHPDDETPDVQKQRWFAGAAEDSDKHRVWNSLMAEEGSEDFFFELSQLRHSQDFKVDSADLTRRVWQVLEAADKSEALRKELLAVATAERARVTCGDGRILLFNGLEIKAYEFNALKNIEPAHKGRELLKLSRGLFRLSKVEDHAREVITKAEEIARTPAGSGARIDPAEIRLAYRIGLTERLGLPEQPKTMLYANMAKVTAQDLDKAATTILALETQPEFVEQLVARPYWIKYLEEKYTQAFSELRKGFDAKNEALETRHATFNDEYFRAVAVLASELEAELHQLAVRLSTTELGEQPA